MATRDELYTALRNADAAGDSEGAAKLAAYIQALPASQPTAQSPPATEVPPDPSEGGGTLSFGPFDTGIKTTQGVDRFLSGAGKAFVDVGRGAGQYLGLESRGDVAASRALDAPLMKTGMGKFGNFAGNVAMAIPTVAIPGANTVTGAGVLGATMGALQPSVNTRETLTNIGMGGAVGAASQYAGQKISGAITDKLAAREASAATHQSLNAERDAVLSEARQAGYVVPPTAANPSALNTALESVSGKAATRQVASAENATVTNKLVRGDLGLPENAPISRDALKAVRNQAGGVYKAIKGIGQISSDAQYTKELQGILQAGKDLEAAYPDIGAQANQQVQQLIQSISVPEHSSEAAVNLSKLLRNRASSNFKSAFAQGGNQQSLELARAQSQAANAVEDLIQRHLESTGQSALGQAWDSARTLIAKSYQAQAALKGNNISAVKLAAQLAKDRPISGGMGLAARFAEHFGEAAKLPQSGAGVSKLAASINLAGAGTALATGNPAIAGGIIAAGSAPYAARHAILSRVGQNILATPNYAPSTLGTLGYQGVNALARGAYPLSLGLVETAQ